MTLKGGFCCPRVARRLRVEVGMSEEKDEKVALVRGKPMVLLRGMAVMLQWAI